MFKELSSVIEYQLGGLFRDLSLALIAESNEYIASQIHNEIKVQLEEKLKFNSSLYT